MNQTERPLTSQEIDDGWCLEEAPAPASVPEPEEPYEEYLLETRAPRSGFEQAFWEQHEGRTLKRRFGDASASFGMPLRARGTRPPRGASA